jgi:hypothetical protein
MFLKISVKTCSSAKFKMSTSEICYNSSNFYVIMFGNIKRIRQLCIWIL